MRRLLPIVLVLAGCPRPTPRPGAATTERRVVVSSTRPSGSSVMTTAPDGTITITLDVLENGRGPHTDAVLRLGGDGTIVSLTATGHHEMATKVDETFARDGDRVRWKSTEEAGEREVACAAYFLPMADLPEVDGFLVRAALRAGGTLPLLPTGEAHVAQVAEMTVTAAGAARTLHAYAITGLELTPKYTWMNPDGTWFGTVSSWFSVVPEGWEAAIAPLIERQRELTSEADARLAAAEAHRPPAAGLAYTHARVLDVERGRWLADQTVVVVGDTITAIGASAKVPAGAEVVDLAGRALIPGMVDMHSHLFDGDGVLDIASGVTTARDVGNDPDDVDDYKARFDAGTAIGPHVVRFGFIEGRGEKAASSVVTAETEAEAEAAVELFAARGYEGIKIYNSMKVELVPVLAAAAHARGMRVTGHIPVHMLAHEAVLAGYDGIEHVNMLFLDFFATHETDTRDTTRFTLVGERAAAFDLGGEQAGALFTLLRDRQTVVDPTVAAFEDLLVGEPGKITPGLEDTVARFPIQTQREFLLGGLPLEDDERATFRASYDKMLAMVVALHEHGIPVVVGTDHIGGLMFHHELALYARAGLAPADILRMATIAAARAVGQETIFGSIEVGKRADLVVVDGDPLADIHDASRVVTTMRGGVVYRPAALFESVGVRP
jgi:imidazolonepropionase-like amidohydrolase